MERLKHEYCRHAKKYKEMQIIGYPGFVVIFRKARWRDDFSEGVLHGYFRLPNLPAIFGITSNLNNDFCIPESVTDLSNSCLKDFFIVSGCTNGTRDLCNGLFTVGTQ